MIIGIAGPSCSGKSTVAKEVAEALGAHLLHMDGRWIAGAEKPLVNGHPSFERPHQYDPVSLLAELHEARKAHRDVVVEGFLLFTYPAVLAELDRLFFLSVDHEELVWRRMARSAAGGNATWGAAGNDAVVDVGWLAHGREEWAEFGAGQALLPGVHVLDGHRATSESARELLEAIGHVPASAS